MRIPFVRCVLAFAFATRAILYGDPTTESVSNADGEAAITLSVSSPLTAGANTANGQIEIVVLGSDNAFTIGDTLTVTLFEDDAVFDEIVFTDTVTVTSPEVAAQRVTRIFPLVFDPGGLEPHDSNLELYAELLVEKETTSGVFDTHDNPVTSLLIVSVEEPDPVDVRVTSIEVMLQPGGVDVTLAVETLGGRLLVDSVEVAHALAPDGPWSPIGSISGDGESYTGTVTAPAGSTGFLRVKAP